MRIRHKITLWIAGAGVLASLLFSVIVFCEMIEQPYRLIDNDLESMGRTMVRLVETARTRSEDSVQKGLPFDTQQYWVKIYDDHRQVCIKQS